MIEQKYVLLIMTCKKYHDKMILQKKSWLQDIPSYIKYFHVIGDSSLKKEYEFNYDENMLVVNTKDDYVSLPKKVIQAYYAVDNEYQYHYIFKTDDDQILTKPHFFTTLISLIDKTKSQYGGNVINVSQPYTSKYHLIHPDLPSNLPVYATKYCSGRFYFLSKECVVDLLKNKLYIRNEFLEDYAIGYHMSQIFKDRILKIDTSIFFRDMTPEDAQYIDDIHSTPPPELFV
jgi:hypothetical protein